MTSASLTRWLALILISAGCASSGKPAAAPMGPAELDEPALMEKIRTQVKPNPASALALVEEGERRFSDSGHTEERAALAIQALVNLDRIGAARSRAYKFLEHYPNGPYSAQVAAMTGVHLTPRGLEQGQGLE